MLPLRFRAIPVAGDSGPAARSGPADTTWMPHPRRWNDMNAASMQYGSDTGGARVAKVRSRVRVTGSEVESLEGR